MNNKIKAPADVVEHFFQDLDPKGTQTAKIGDSANGVVIASSVRSPDDVVAVKIGPSEKIEREYGYYKELRGIVGGEHTIPEGRVLIATDSKTGSEYGALITPFLPDLQPFSRQDLFLPKQGALRASRLGEFAQLLATMQSAGLFHGDFQAKNVGNRANGIPMVFDMEAASKLTPNSPELARHILHDLLSFYKSLAIKSLYSLNPEPLLHDIESLFTEQWLQSIHELGTLCLDSAIGAAVEASSKFNEWTSNGGLERAKIRFAPNDNRPLAA